MCQQQQWLSPLEEEWLAEQIQNGVVGAARPLVTQERARQRISYDEKTGNLYWITGNFAGKVAGGTHRDGGRQIWLDGFLYQAHRLAWFLTYERWPFGDIDHINGDRADNRLCNLRDVSRSVNLQNQRRAKSLNRLLGTSKTNGGNWQSRIFVDGKTVNLGVYKTEEQAHAAYVVAKRTMHEGCTI